MTDEHRERYLVVRKALDSNLPDFDYRLRAGIGAGLQREIQAALSELRVPYRSTYPDQEYAIYVPSEVAEIAEMIALRVENCSSTWPYVQRFAVLMEHKFSLNMHKGGRETWMQMPPEDLYSKLCREMGEVAVAFVEWIECPCPTHAKALALECADVGNYGVELSDRVGGL